MYPRAFYRLARPRTAVDVAARGACGRRAQTEARLRSPAGRAGVHHYIYNKEQREQHEAMKESKTKNV